MLFLPFVALSHGRRSLCTHGTRRWWSSTLARGRRPPSSMSAGFRCVGTQVPKKITKGFPPRRVALSVPLARTAPGGGGGGRRRRLAVDRSPHPGQQGAPRAGRRRPRGQQPGPPATRVVTCHQTLYIHDTCICMYHVNNNPARDTIGETKKARERKQVSPEVAEWSTGLAEQARRLPPLRHPDQRRRTLPLARGDHAGPWTLAPPPRRKEKKRWHAERELD